MSRPLRFALGLVYEPARPNGDVVHSRKGTGNFVATCYGRAAHAASPTRAGRNAIAALAEFLVGAHRIPDELPGVMLNIGNIRGGGPATNVVPDFAEAKLDLRVTRMADRDPFIARLLALAAPINARDGLHLALTGAFMVVEVIGGWLSGSLALLADAGHMLTDVGALALSLLTAWIAQRQRICVVQAHLGGRYGPRTELVLEAVQVYARGRRVRRRRSGSNR